MPRASHKYTSKDARTFTGGYTDQTRLKQARQQVVGFYIRHIPKLKGEEPVLPPGVAVDSAEGVKIWKKAYDKALDADALRGWIKKNPEKNALIRGPPLPSGSHRIPDTAPIHPPRRRTLAERRDLATKTRVRVAAAAAAKQATADSEVVEEMPVKNGARAVNIRGLRIVCDTDDEDDIQLNALVNGKDTSAKEPIAKEHTAPAKRSIVEVDDDDAAGEDSPANKRRRRDFAIVRPESEKENHREKKKPENPARGPHAKAPGSPPISPRPALSKQDTNRPVKPVARNIAVPKRTSEKPTVERYAKAPGSPSPMPRVPLSKQDTNQPPKQVGKNVAVSSRPNKMLQQQQEKQQLSKSKPAPINHDTTKHTSSSKGSTAYPSGVVKSRSTKGATVRSRITNTKPARAPSPEKRSIARRRAPHDNRMRSLHEAADDMRHERRVREVTREAWESTNLNWR